MKTYITKTGKTQYKPSFKALQQIMEGDNSEGFCLACGHHAYGVEPDVRRYTCEALRITITGGLAYGMPDHA